jgi:hypothetical protein
VTGSDFLELKGEAKVFPSKKLFFNNKKSIKDIIKENFTMKETMD